MERFAPPGVQGAWWTWGQRSVAERESMRPVALTSCPEPGEAYTALQPEPEQKPWAPMAGASAWAFESFEALIEQKGEGVDEGRLIKRLRRRDERAFNYFVVRYQGQIFNLCLRMLGNAAEAEDLAQDVFVKAFQAISTFRGDSSLGTWLYRIAANLCKNRLKYLSRRRYNATSQFENVPESVWAGRTSRARPTTGEPAARPDQALEGARAQTRVQKALAAVDPDFRELLVLRDIQGLSYAEVRRITGLADGTVKSRLHRARAALKRAYTALEGSP